MLLPTNAGDPSSMVAQALTIYKNIVHGNRAHNPPKENGKDKRGATKDGHFSKNEHVQDASTIPGDGPFSFAPDTTAGGVFSLQKKDPS
jgi:hypothetical protein